MDIVCCLDENYVMPCGVLLLSIFDNNKEEEIVIHIITEGLKESSQKELINIVEQYGKQINFYNIDLAKLNDCYKSKGLQYNYCWSISTFYRIWLSSVLPKDIDKVLYLDCDIIVCGSLMELWNINIDDYAIAASPDKRCDDIRIFNRLSYESSLGYCNMGVLLVNLAYWRTHNAENELISYMNANLDILEFVDQDVLNYVFRARKKELSMRYNVVDQYFEETNYMYIKRERWDDLFESLKHPVIIHYANYLKPWHKGSTFYFKDFWIKYYKLSKWKNDSFVHRYSIFDRFKYRIKSLLISYKLIGMTEPRYRKEYHDKVKHL